MALYFRYNSKMICLKLPEGVDLLELLFDESVRPEVWNPYRFSKDFLPLKSDWFDFFRKSGPTRGFLPQNGWFYKVFAIYMI